jgi:hypothetical protein
MPRPARVDPAAGREAVDAVRRALDSGDAASVDPEALRLAVRAIAARLQELAPGHSIEVRIPGPAGTAFQCGEGPKHTRGTPPNVVETDAVTFVELATGRTAWVDAAADGRVRASGLRADLSGLLPLVG